MREEQDAAEPAQHREQRGPAAAARIHRGDDIEAGEQQDAERAEARPHQRMRGLEPDELKDPLGAEDRGKRESDVGDDADPDEALEPSQPLRTGTRFHRVIGFGHDSLP